MQQDATKLPIIRSFHSGNSGKINLQSTIPPNMQRVGVAMFLASILLILPMINTVQTSQEYELDYLEEKQYSPTEDECPGFDDEIIYCEFNIEDYEIIWGDNSSPHPWSSGPPDGAYTWSSDIPIIISSFQLSQNQLDQMIENGLEVISAGANVPFADKEIFFGPISRNADEMVSVLPDFIANCGMARAFSYFMQDDCQMNDIAIFTAVSNTIKDALIKSFEKNNAKINISKTAFEIALKQLI